MLAAIEVRAALCGRRDPRCCTWRCSARSRSPGWCRSTSCSASPCCHGSLLAVALGFTPIFIANLVFAERFRNVEESNVAFGANLLGAMVGGLLEYVALMTGYQALLLLVAALYGAAFFTGRVHLREGAATSAARVSSTTT